MSHSVSYEEARNDKKYAMGTWSCHSISHTSRWSLFYSYIDFTVVVIGLSTRERSYFNEYNKSLARFMNSVQGIDITQNLTPPKSLYAEVICVEDAGVLDLDSGNTI